MTARIQRSGFRVSEQRWGGSASPALCPVDLGWTPDSRKSRDDAHSLRCDYTVKAFFPILILYSSSTSNASNKMPATVSVLNDTDLFIEA